MSTQLRFKRLFSFAFGSLAMLAVAMLSAFVTMRLAIHGRETVVPAFSGLTLPEAQQRARSKGLNLLVENRFYSTVIPAGHILSQLPAPGQTVRRDWQVRVAESLGAQRVSIPDVVGQSERSANITLRRLSLDLGTMSHVAADGAPGTVLAQTPPPNAQGVDGPHVSLLVSDAAPGVATPGAAAQGGSPEALVMPVLTGLPAYAAQARAAAAGLHVVVTPDPVAAAADPNNPAPFDPLAGPAAPVAPTAPTGNVVSQYPQAGHRVLRGAGVHLGFAHPAPAPDATLAPAPTATP